MEILNTKTQEALYKSIIQEAAKARNEIKCAEADIKKANNRLSFVVVLANELLNRTDKKEK